MIILINGLVIYYLLELLLLDNGGMGPGWGVGSIKVIFFDKKSENTYEWQATWVDYLRRVFGMYEVSYNNVGESDSKDKIWYTKDSQMTRLWQCEFCLGFWLAVILTVLNIFSESDILNFIIGSFFSVMASAGLGAFLYSLTLSDSGGDDVSS
jgi:hypothetical protein